jgi:oligopeptide transport system substrate-binding protein
MELKTRRAFLISVSGAALFLTSCGQSGSELSSSGTPMNTPGQVLYRIGNAAEPASLDPHHAVGTWEDHIIGDLMMGLTTESADGEPLPGAAEKWETSSDGLTWTFHLRDHQWSDGQPVKASDFVYAWRRILDPKTAANYAYFLYLFKNAQAVNSGKMPLTALGAAAPDDKTLVVQLEHPAPYLTQFIMHMTTYPVPQHVVEMKGDAWSRPENYVGNGAFVLKDWIPNDHVAVEKNPKFWDAANVKIDRIVYYPTTDYEAALKRFRAGELDVQDRLPSLEIDFLRANMPETLRIAPLLVTEYLVVNAARKPFGDARVREALNLAIDRETLTQKIIKVGDVPAYGDVPPAVANYPGGAEMSFKSMPQPDRIKRAQMLMTQAGYGPNKLLKTTYAIRSASPDSLRIPSAIQSMLKAIYVDADIVQNDTAVFYNKMEQHDFDIGAAAWQGDFNDPTTFLDLMRKGNANNYGGYDNAKYDALLDRAAKEPDLGKRGETLLQAEKIALGDFAWIPLYFWVSGALVRPYVKGYENNGKDIHRTRWISIDEEERAATLR